jgi:hypothetical protein
MYAVQVSDTTVMPQRTNAGNKKIIVLNTFHFIFAAHEFKHTYTSSSFYRAGKL